ncbi:hypothetical protein K502DRAFT_342376 [Neoconidiobolus thromboides FSU 785]|nr:hypothetical protein K502DRAFT_342376 [Neoconidiobolus thromboides FSU 785]
MALKVEIEQWQEAVKCFEEENYSEALSIFQDLPESFRVALNIGLVYDAMDDIENSLKSFETAVGIDQYSAIGHYCKGNARFKLESYEEAIEDYDKSFQYLRGNLLINYAQLGLDHTLYSCEVAYNRSLCYSRLENKAKFKEDIMYAMVNKQLDSHSAIIPKAVKKDGKECEPILLPKGSIFRPAETKSKNTKKVDYLGKSKVIGAQDDKDSFTGFAGKQAKENAGNSSPMPQITPVEIPEKPPVKLKSIDDTVLAEKKRLHAEKKKRESRKIKLPTPPSTGSSAPGSPTNASNNKVNKHSAVVLTNQNHQIGALGTPANFYTQMVNQPYMNHPAMIKPSIPKLPLPPGQLKVKVHYNETCVLLMKTDVKFEKLLDRVQKKFNNSKLRLRYRDEDDDFILMTEQEDLDIARGYLGDSKHPPADRVELYAGE